MTKIKTNKKMPIDLIFFCCGLLTISILAASGAVTLWIRYK